MSASSVIFRGYAGGLIVTRGYAPGAPAVVTQVTSRDVSGHGRPDRGRLTPRELAELNVAEALRNAPEPIRTEDTRTPPDVPKIVTETKQNVVNLDDYRSPSLDGMDAAIAAANKALSALLAANIAKEASERLLIQQMADMDEDLAITLLLLD